jgi:uncharacterized protein YbjT (DUF2867 family)
MRVMVVGATGLIGMAVTARLVASGHEVVGLGRRAEPDRDRGANPLRPMRWIRFDLAQALTPEHWMAPLAGVDAVVNCAGILQDAPGERARHIHTDAVLALGQACARAGVKRLVHFSAIGVDRGTPTEFSQTKLAGDEALMRLSLDWIILRPAVVVGRQAYGGSALFRGLAALPLLPLMPDTGPIQVVQLDDVVDTVVFFLTADAPTRVCVDLAGPERYAFADIVRLYRWWLGWNEPKTIALPGWAAAGLYRMGDIVSLLGWRPPLRTTARREIVRGAIGDPTEWMRMTGIRPRSLRAALAAEPAGVQERWFAPLYILKPVLFVVLALFWLITAFNSVGPGYHAGVALMEEGGAGFLSGPSVIAGGLADLVIGIGIAFRKTARPALLAALALSIFYAVAGTLLLPRLWIEPLGPIVKIFPIFVTMVTALILLRDR